MKDPRGGWSINLRRPSQGSARPRFGCNQQEALLGNTGTRATQSIGGLARRVWSFYPFYRARAGEQKARLQKREASWLVSSNKAWGISQLFGEPETEVGLIRSKQCLFSRNGYGRGTRKESNEGAAMGTHLVRTLADTQVQGVARALCTSIFLNQ